MILSLKNFDNLLLFLSLKVGVHFMNSQHLRLKWHFEKLDKYGPWPTLLTYLTVQSLGVHRRLDSPSLYGFSDTYTHSLYVEPCGITLQKSFHNQYSELVIQEKRTKQNSISLFSENIS